MTMTEVKLTIRVTMSMMEASLDDNFPLGPPKALGGLDLRVDISAIVAGFSKSPKTVC